MVNNVETFACAAKIADARRRLVRRDGHAAIDGHQAASRSPATAGGPASTKYPFGVTVRQVLIDCGAEDAHAVQVCGPSGTCISLREFDRRIAFEDVATAGAFMVFSRERDMFEVARNFTHFFAHESCGFCTPCRVGTSLLAQHHGQAGGGQGLAPTT